MNDLPLAKVELLGTSRVSVTPVHPDPSSYEYIYRAALGVAWDRKIGSFLSPNDYMLESRKEFAPLENMYYLVAALLEEMGLRPKPTKDTLWVGVDESLKVQIETLIAARVAEWEAYEATREERTGEFAETERLRTMRLSAEAAWTTKDYASLVRLYRAEPSHLTPLEKARLNYAEKR
jgi:hypothetical protein